MCRLSRIWSYLQNCDFCQCFLLKNQLIFHRVQFELLTPNVFTGKAAFVLKYLKFLRHLNPEPCRSDLMNPPEAACAVRPEPVLVCKIMSRHWTSLVRRKKIPFLKLRPACAAALCVCESER